MRTNKINVIALVSMDLLLHFGLLYIVSIDIDSILFVYYQLVTTCFLSHFVFILFVFSKNYVTYIKLFFLFWFDKCLCLMLKST